MRRLQHHARWFPRLKLDLDDLDEILGLLRARCGTIRVIAGGSLIETTADLEALHTRSLPQLDIEADEPYFRLRFGDQPSDVGLVAITTIAGDPASKALRTAIDPVLDRARKRRRRRPSLAVQYRENPAIGFGLIAVPIAAAPTLLVLAWIRPKLAAFLAAVLGVLLIAGLLIYLIAPFLPTPPVLLLERRAKKDAGKDQPEL